MLVQLGRRSEAARVYTALEAALRSFVLAESPPRTLRATLAAGQRLGSIVRDQISLDTWRVLSQLDHSLERLAQGGEPPLGDVLEVLNGLILSCAAFSARNVCSRIGKRS